MSKSDKLPALQFYPGDWRKDVGVQALSFHDRGIWFEILMLMHESEQRGKLMLNGAPMPVEALAKVLGLDNQILTTALTTLATYGVSSICQDTGAIMCRRMVRDEHIREVRKKSGKMGGNPNLVNQTSNQDATTGVKQNPTPSSSSSSSYNTPLPPEGDGLGLELDSDPVPQTKPWIPTEDQLQINSWFRRRHDTRWSEKELRAFRKLPPTPDEDWHLLERYYLGPGDGRYPRQDVFTLLNNWQGEIDRARKWSETNIRKSNGRASLNL